LQICENIRLAREEKGFSQTKMADLLNVSRTTYRNWEEETEPSLTIIKSIATALEVSPLVLLKGIIEPEKPETFSLNDPDLQFQAGIVGLNFRRSELQKIKEGLDILQNAFSKIS
jgi:transcriptional regulator with XRE-family HTH domain